MHLGEVPGGGFGFRPNVIPNFRKPIYTHPMSTHDPMERQKQLLADTSLSARSGPLPGADGYGKRESDCDDTIEIYLAVKDSVVTETSFLVRGCVFTLACARAAAALAKGKVVSGARRETSPQAIEKALGGLPPDNFHAAELASGAMADALEDAAFNAREPWRKIYQHRR